MHIPYCLPLKRDGKRGNTPDWQDPIRGLYPNHAEFWPSEPPEHHQMLQRHLRMARKRRRLMLIKLLKWCLGRPLEGARARNVTVSEEGRKGMTPNTHTRSKSKETVSFFHPLQNGSTAPQTETRPLPLSSTLPKACCHGDCR